MKIEPPKIDDRKFSDIFKRLRAIAPHYTPEWPASGEKDAGTALLKICAYIIETTIKRLNQAPEKNFIAFLDMLGIKLLPARPSRAPLTFKLAMGTEKDILIQARTQATSDKTAEHEELPFETEKNLRATISNLKEVISVDPFNDTLYVHTANVVSNEGGVLDKQQSFALFSGTNLQEHSLYTGHKDLFNIESKGKIIIKIKLAPGKEIGNSSLKLIWGYWGENKEKEKDEWIELQVLEDGTNGFQQSGEITLLKTADGKIKEEKLGEIFKKTSREEIKDKTVSETKTRWIRCRLKDKLTTDSLIKLPTIDTIFIKTSPSDPITPDAGFFNDVPLDMKALTEPTEKGRSIPELHDMSFKAIFPFGKQPKLYDSFYIGSKEAFSKKDAKITMNLSLFILDTSGVLTVDPRLSWEYWNAKGWQVLTILKDETDRFLLGVKNRAIEFYCPKDIEEIEVGGQKNYWIRARIVGGDYGREEYTLEESSTFSEITTTKESKTKVERKFKLPVICNLTINYSFESKKELQCCLTYNNLAYQDKTTESKTQGLYFHPFVSLKDINLNLYLGFDKPLTGGPIRIFFAAQELSYIEEKKPKMEWKCRYKTDWALLDYLDETEGLIIQGHLEFIGPSGFSSYTQFGQSLYWIQGSLVKGAYDAFPELQGVYPNTTWAIQAMTIKDELLGSSSGEGKQTFSFLKVPVMEGEEIRVREALSEEEKESLIGSMGGEALLEVKDEQGKVKERWALLKEVPDFFDSSKHDRHYVIDRATGLIQFGDGIRGMIPPAGEDNIKAFSYQTGGGKTGNVKAWEIRSLKSAVAGLDKVTNPGSADGGADTATLDQMLEIGPAAISHRNRAVTAEDFEWLAKEASRKVVRARCLPNTNNNKQRETGRVTVVIIPDSLEEKPFPSLALRKMVRRYLEDHSSNTLASRRHIHIDGPDYIDISVSVDIYISSMDVASEAECEALKRLKAFFNPLTGGPEGNGWEFGRDVAASDVHVLLEDIKGVDHTENLTFTAQDKTYVDMVEVKDDFLVASGEHRVKIHLRTGG